MSVVFRKSKSAQTPKSPEPPRSPLPPEGAKPAHRPFFNYPRKHITSFRRWLPSWKFILGSILSLIACAAGFLGAAWVTTDVPSTPLPEAQAQTTSVYYSDGTTLLGTFSDENRTDVNINDLPDYVPEAIVASEDKTFYQNSGVDIESQIRAFLNNLSGGDRQGGSTITQQYIERYYVGDTTTYVGKLQEAIRAVKVRQEQSPDQILQGYMNTIYFGRDAYGIQAAAQAYFGVDAKDLTISQAALLAGIIPSPNNYDPAVDKDAAEARWNHALNGMVDNGYITSAQRSALVFPTTITYAPSDEYTGTQGYLLEMVKQELTSGSNAPFTEDQLNRGGYKIVTTFDKADQDALVAAVNNTMPGDTPDNLKVASASIDTSTGAVRAVYGGKDYSTVQQNAATQDSVQAGSTFKVFTLAAALEDGISLDQYYNGDSPKTITFNDGTVWSGLTNENNRSYGDITVTQALAESVNTVFAQINKDVGPDATENAAIRAGIPEGTAGLNADPSNVLGTASPHPIDVADAYATFANGGTYHPWYTVSSVTDTNGKVIYQGQTEGKKEFSTDVATDVTYAMQQVVTSPGGTGYRAAKLGKPVAGKTGTTDGHSSIWFTGYTPQLATTVAMYQLDSNGNPVPKMDLFGGYGQMNGGDLPTMVWTNYMEAATANMPTEQFPDRVDIGSSTGKATPSAYLSGQSQIAEQGQTVGQPLAEPDFAATSASSAAAAGDGTGSCSATSAQTSLRGGRCGNADRAADPIGRKPRNASGQAVTRQSDGSGSPGRSPTPTLRQSTAAAA